jgi:hypothetical protein
MVIADLCNANRAARRSHSAYPSLDQHGPVQPERLPILVKAPPPSERTEDDGERQQRESHGVLPGQRQDDGDDRRYESGGASSVQKMVQLFDVAPTDNRRPRVTSTTAPFRHLGL